MDFKTASIQKDENGSWILPRNPEKRNEQVFKKSEKQRWLQSESKEQPEEIQKEKKEIRLKNLQKLEAYQKELKLKQWQKRKENHL